MTGVIPEALAAKEIAHTGLSELHVVASMHARKALMANLADGFIALPGGWGTLEELLEVLTWAQLVRRENRSMILVSSSPGTLLDQFEESVPRRVEKWIDAAAT